MKLGALLALAIALASGMYLFERSRRPPSILLITVDTLRADRIGAYGHPTNQTPAIDRLAQEGMVFERAYCDMPWTTGSMASVMTGHYSNVHGLRLPIEKLTPEALTMAELLHSHGWQTGAIIGSFPLDAVYGLDQGFETYDDEFSLPMIAVDAPVTHIESQLPETGPEQAEFIREKFKNDAYRPDEAVTDAAVRWLDTVRDGRPFLLWVHYFGPHEKLRGDVGFVAQEPAIIAAYDPDVEVNDRAVGRLLDHLRRRSLLDRTLVILHADHGQNLGEHDYVGHSIRLDEASVRIPMILRYPRRIPPGTRRLDIARNIDILPTVLDAAAIDIEGLAGRSLLPLFDDPQASADTVSAYFETYVPTLVPQPVTRPGVGALFGSLQRLGVRTPEWKLVSEEFVGPCMWGKMPQRDAFGAWKVHDDAVQLKAERCAELGHTELLRQADTGLEPVESQPPDVVAALKGEIRRHAERVTDGTDGRFHLSPEQERKLKSLGYLQ